MPMTKKEKFRYAVAIVRSARWTKEAIERRKALGDDPTMEEFYQRIDSERFDRVEELLDEMPSALLRLYDNYVLSSAVYRG